MLHYYLYKLQGNFCSLPPRQRNERDVTEVKINTVFNTRDNKLKIILRNPKKVPWVKNFLIYDTFLRNGLSIMNHFIDKRFMPSWSLIKPI